MFLHTLPLRFIVSLFFISYSLLLVLFVPLYLFFPYVQPPSVSLFVVSSSTPSFLLLPLSLAVCARLNRVPPAEVNHRAHAGISARAFYTVSGGVLPPYERVTGIPRFASRQLQLAAALE